jgi:acetoin utilization protein AcuB
MRSGRRLGMDRDAFRREAERAFGTVRESMTSRSIAFEPQDRASDAALQLGAQGVSGGPVVEAGRVVGMVTLSDLLVREGHVASQTSGPFLRGERHLAHLTVADVMTRNVVSVGADEPLVRAAELMDSAGVNRLPVVDDLGKPIGIVARDDVIRAIALVVRELVPARSITDAPAPRTD